MSQAEHFGVPARIISDRVCITLQKKVYMGYPSRSCAMLSVLVRPNGAIASESAHRIMQRLLTVVRVHGKSALIGWDPLRRKDIREYVSGTVDYLRIELHPTGTTAMEDVVHFVQEGLMQFQKAQVPGWSVLMF